MAATNRFTSIKHLTTVPLRMTEDDKPFQLVCRVMKCKSPSDMARIKPEKWEDPFVYDTTDEKGNMVQVNTTLAEAEVQELLDLQEFIRNHKNNVFIVWTAVTADEFEEFRDDLMDDSAANKAQAAALAVAAVTTQTTAIIGNTTALANQSTGAYKMRRLYTDYKEITKRHFFTQWFKEV
jgi:hypothetical protein